ncbi:hypothetical protein JCM10599A_66180 [Paraburkholderia kururiensis]
MVNKFDPEIGEPCDSGHVDIARALAESLHARVRLEEDPQVQRGTPEKRETPAKLWAEDLEAVCVSGTNRRQRPSDTDGIFHKINALRMEFEV